MSCIASGTLAYLRRSERKQVLSFMVTVAVIELMLFERRRVIMCGCTYGYSVGHDPCTKDNHEPTEIFR